MIGGRTKPKMLVAKGAFLSVLGNFVQAKACLEAAIPLMNRDDKELYFEAMIHKAGFSVISIHSRNQTGC
jgi:hypothetical protein